jgi:hypothetical protein
LKEFLQSKTIVPDSPNLSYPQPALKWESALRLLEAIIDACKGDHGTSTLTAMLTDAWSIVVVVLGVPDFYIHALVNLCDTERSNPPGDDIDAFPQAERKTG